jgi:hypothetical protein
MMSKTVNINRMLENLYEMKDFDGVGKVKWNAIKHLTPIEFQMWCNPREDYSMVPTRLIGVHTYASVLYPIHRDKLCSDCMWCEIDDEYPLDDWIFEDED